MTEREQEVAAQIAHIIESYPDVFAEDVEMPMLSDWCLVTAHQSALDASVAEIYCLNNPHLPNYRAYGLLQYALDECREDEDV